MRMKIISSRCAGCGLFQRRSIQHEEEYQNSALLERLRTSNFPATGEETFHVQRTILPTVDDDISSIESNLATLREVVTSMQEEREKLINLRKKFNNLISLHRALPSEIWSEIFLYTLSSYSDFNAFDASVSMWRLSHVCQSWRNITLSLQSFWSTVKIRLPKLARREGDVQRLETVIQRSRQAPLDVSVYRCASERRTAHPLILNRLLDAIFAESYRWRKADLSYAQGSWNTFYAPLHNRLPHLESLDLCFNPPQVEEQSVSVFEFCPRLTKLRLTGQSPLVAKLPWDQITELDLADIEFEGPCMELISQCPSLKTLLMPLRLSEDHDGESAYTPLTCLNLSQLDVMSASVVDALTLPHLRMTSLEPQSATTQDNILYSLEKLLIRSDCLSALTSLSLSHVPLAASSEHSLTSILPQMRSLTLLDLEIVEDYEHEMYSGDEEEIVALVKSLKVVPTESVTFLPFLSCLDIRVFDHMDEQSLLCFGPVGSLASTLQTRWKGDNTLGLARLTKCRFVVQAEDMSFDEAIVRDDAGDSVAAGVFSEEEGHVFDALIDEGMDLRIAVMSEGKTIRFTQFHPYW